MGWADTGTVAMLVKDHIFPIAPGKCLKAECRILKNIYIYIFLAETNVIKSV